ncbi:Nrap protein [Phlebopus sp. FC_14]|nr:Nrap protein [Phlebopus sp. FC_14]
MAHDLKRKRGERAVGHAKKQRTDSQSEDEISSEDEMTTARINKPPTAEELRVIRDAVDLYQSTSFKLQIDAVLPGIRPKETRKASLDRFLLALRSHLLSLPETPPQNPLSAARALSKKGVAVPFSLPHPTSEVKWKVSFEPPSDIHVVGSWANHISVKKKDGGNFGVDVIVEMPSSLFQEKDYLDARYFHKRSYYLAVLAQSVSSSLGIDTFYGAAIGDPRLAVLILRSRKGSNHDFTKLHAEVRIIPILPSTHPIPLSRLSPSHSNVRLHADSRGSTPTPIYNTAILLSTFPKLDLLYTNELKKLSPAFTDAHALLRIWANQRGYGEGAMCIRGFEGKGYWWSSLLGFVVMGEEPSNIGSGRMAPRRPIGKGLSSYQLFRASLDFLAKHEFERIPAFVKTTNGHRFHPEEYVSHHTAIFVDATSTVNLLADVPLTSLEMLRYDAHKTLEHLNNSLDPNDVFADVFLKDQTCLSDRCDAIIRIDLSRVSKTQSPAELVNHGTYDNALLSAISEIVRRGLGDRIQAIAIFHPSTGVRAVSESQSPRIPAIHVGLIYSPENAFRLVDHGPASEEQKSEAAQRFRQLWGDRAELRRFKDGRIIESVVWEVKTSDERAHIPADIVKYLLHHHFGIPAQDMQTIQSPFDEKLRLPDDVSRLLQSSGPGGFKAAIAAFDEIVRNLKALDDDLPLALLNVSPASECLRYTSAFSPTPIPSSSSLALPEPLRYLSVIDIILEFEKSSKWPDDLRAIQKIKLAFFETMASKLMIASPGLRASVHIGDPTTTNIQDQASLDILTSEGWAFSARIWHDREATLLNRLIDSSRTAVRPLVQFSTSNSKEQREAKQALDVYTRRFIHSPRHHRAVANLCHRYSAYSGTVRLVKRWLASHWLLGSHVSQEAVEMICARPFVGTSTMLPETAANVPRSKERGFALVVQFLRDWKPEDPLFVPLYEDAGPAPKPSVMAVGSKQGVWTIATSEDAGGKIWTSNKPDAIAAHRLRALAKEACKIMQEADADPYDVKRLFSHATNDYDVLIELDSSILPRYYQAIDADPAVWSKNRIAPMIKAGLVSRPGFDPARLLFDDLHATFSETLKFFFDVYGGHRIGAVWLPGVSGSRPFRALGRLSSTPVPKEKSSDKDKGSVMVNQQSIIDEIRRLGSGLIKKVTVQHQVYGLPSAS